MTLGERIYGYRKGKGMSQDELAGLLEVSRQSVSKWETDQAVPDLERLVKMSGIFGVTLDELVCGAIPTTSEHEDSKEAEREAPPARSSSSRMIAGTILLCFAALTFLVFTVIGGVFSGFIFALPFALCGAVCFIFKKRVGLWCCWAVFFAVDLYFSQSSALNRANILHTFSWTYEMNYMILILSWISFLVLAALIVWTAFSFRSAETAKRRALTMAVSSAAAIVASRVIGRLLAKWFFDIVRTPELEYSVIRSANRIYSLCSFGLGWLETAAFTVLLALGAALIFKWRKERKERL